MRARKSWCALAGFAILALSLVSVFPSCAAPRAEASTAVPAAAAPAADAPSASPALAERHELLMLAAAAFTYANADAAPKPGYDISAVIAWDVEDLAKTPDFVIERNRNMEYQGDIHHAEINTLRRAYERKRVFNVPFSASPADRIAVYSRSLANTTLFTTLEPCPMCAMTMLLARVPRAVYFMEDPGLRDRMTHAITVQLPNAVYGRQLTQVISGLAESATANAAMWTAATSGAKFSITDYLAANAKGVFKPAYERFQSTGTAHPENEELLKRLRAAVGTSLGAN